MLIVLTAIAEFHSGVVTLGVGSSGLFFDDMFINPKTASGQ